MYILFMKKIREDNTLTKDEEVRRCANLMYYWERWGIKFEELRKTIKQENKLVWEHLSPYYGYLLELKLICEGKALSDENLSAVDLDEIIKFKNSVYAYETPCGD